MPRALLTSLGIGLFLVGGGVLAVAGFPTEIPMGLFVLWTACAGAAFVVAGRRERVQVGPRSVRWYVFAGVGDVALAGAALSVAVPDLLASARPAVSVVSDPLGGLLGVLALACVGLGCVHGAGHREIGPGR